MSMSVCDLRGGCCLREEGAHKKPVKIASGQCDDGEFGAGGEVDVPFSVVETPLLSGL